MWLNFCKVSKIDPCFVGVRNLRPSETSWKLNPPVSSFLWAIQIPGGRWPGLRPGGKSRRPRSSGRESRRGARGPLRCGGRNQRRVTKQQNGESSLGISTCLSGMMVIGEINGNHLSCGPYFGFMKYDNLSQKYKLGHNEGFMRFKWDMNQQQQFVLSRNDQQAGGWDAQHGCLPAVNEDIASPTVHGERTYHYIIT